MQKNALQVARRYEKEAKERLRRISLVAAGLDSFNAKSSTLGAIPGPGANDAWCDEKGNTSYRDETEALG